MLNQARLLLRFDTPPKLVARHAGATEWCGAAWQGTVGMNVSALCRAARQLLSLLQLSVGSVGLQLVSKVVLSRASGRDWAPRLRQSPCLRLTFSELVSLCTSQQCFSASTGSVSGLFRSLGARAQPRSKSSPHFDSADSIPALLAQGGA